ncbi:MAG: glycosyltransferase [Phycisphaerae bacterium]|jgi:glycosyltransferase involved in cell wall biosynthesis
MDKQDQPRIAVLIPCHNEEVAIGKVIDDFRAALPSAEIYVFDNCCTDRTAQIAQERGAVVIREGRKGKGFVVERMLNDIEADYCVMVDGDDTYDAAGAGRLLGPVLSGEADMAVAARMQQSGPGSFPSLHRTGNHLVRRLINWIFGCKLTDILSGYRAFNRRVVQRVPVVSSGFEVETELTIQMLYYRLSIVEVPLAYRGRPAGSESKLHTLRDGARVLWKVFSLFRAFKPLTFFGGMGLVLLVLGLLCGLPPINDYIQRSDHYVTHVPLAVLAMGLVLLAAGCIFLGVLLHAINWRFKELHNVMTRSRRR